MSLDNILKKYLGFKIIIFIFIVVLLFVSSLEDKSPTRPLLLTSSIILVFNILYIINNITTKEIFKISLVGVHIGMLFFIIFEYIFMFIPLSHGIGYTLSSQLWFSKYWKPINRFGFRDYDIAEDTTNKKKIIVVGDSFVAGHGIKNIENRFSNILQRKIGRDSYYVFNLGINGADTLQEIRLLKSFPYKADILILEYSPNDIGDRAIANGIQFEGFAPYGDLNPIAKFLCLSHIF